MNAAGATLVESRGPSTERVLRLERVEAGVDEHYIVVTDGQGRPYRDELKSASP